MIHATRDLFLVTYDLLDGETMQTSNTCTWPQPGAKTYSVLDAILQGSTRLPLIAQATGLSYRTVNALVYALEKQGRVVAQNYEVQRCEQELTVLRYNAYPSSNRQSTQRAHPARVLAEQARVRDKQKNVANFQALHQAFFFSPTGSGTPRTQTWA